MRFHCSDIRFPALTFLTIFLGCGQATPKLQYVRIGQAEKQSPTVLAVELHNAGDVDVTISGCEVDLKSTHLFVADGDTTAWPEKFEYHLELLETHEGRLLAPGENRVAAIAFVWDLPLNAPQLIAVCKASFAISYDSDKVKTEEVMFVVANDQVTREKILSEPLSNVRDARVVADHLESFEGKKSDGVMQIIKLLKESQ